MNCITNVADVTTGRCVCVVAELFVVSKFGKLCVCSVDGLWYYRCVVRRACSVADMIMR